MKVRKSKPLVKRSEAHLPVWERGMNPEQLQVIRHDKGPCRVLALAGSGKTRSCVHRIARLIESGVEPERILAVTFSVKAAGEMNERLETLGIEGARVGTWHSLCLQILREDKTEYAKWKVDSTNRAKFLMKDVLGYKEMNWVGADLTKLLSFVGKCKANLFTPSSEGALALAGGMFYLNASKACEAFRRHNVMLEEKRLLTFDDFLVYAAAHLQDRGYEWAQRWEYIIVDEFQDNNAAQNKIAYQLASEHRNYMVIGDCFQALYSFRGSSPMYLAKFNETWPDASTITLPRNYRSGKKIIDAANGILRQAKIESIDPTDMIGERPLDGVVHVKSGATLDDEAKNFVQWVREIVAGGETHNDICCLFRLNAQSRALEEALLGAKIPYVVVGGTSFYERKEVRDLLAYLRVASNTGDGDDVKRSINTPFRFLGMKFVDRLMQATGDQEIANWPAMVETVSQGEGIQSRQKASAHEWARMIRDLTLAVENGIKENSTDDEADKAHPSVLLERIVRETRYMDWITKEEGEESIEQSGCANVREMIRVSERFATVHELITYIDQTTKAAKKQREEEGGSGDRVRLMSIHKSKGLEFPNVFVAGFNEMILPHVRGDIEEERRIAYVAVTRAKNALMLSYVKSLATRGGIKDAPPSRFLLDAQLVSEVPKEIPTPERAPEAPPFS